VRELARTIRMWKAAQAKLGITLVRTRRVRLDSPYAVYGYSGFCSLFRNLRHDGAPSTAVAGHAAKVECDLHAADKARVVIART